MLAGVILVTRNFHSLINLTTHEAEKVNSSAYLMNTYRVSSAACYSYV